MTIHLDGPGVIDRRRRRRRPARDPGRAHRPGDRPDARGRAPWSTGSQRRDADYGISTGFGALATVSIPPERRQALQHALVRSHAAGMGEPVEPEVVRAMMFLRARTLALGFSGARPLVAQAMIDAVNAGIVPVVPEYGSLGASGDLAPLAHAALVLLGEGEAFVDGELTPAADALAEAGL